jgi:hypothetical protein
LIKTFKYIFDCWKNKTILLELLLNLIFLDTFGHKLSTNDVKDWFKRLTNVLGLLLVMLLLYIFLEFFSTQIPFFSIISKILLIISGVIVLISFVIMLLILYLWIDGRLSSNSDVIKHKRVSQSMSQKEVDQAKAGAVKAIQD